jgi:hypothetical protein
MGAAITPTETDYRAWIAMIWSVLLFVVVFAMILTGHDVDETTMVVAIFMSPVGMIIAFYFGAKQG